MVGAIAVLLVVVLLVGGLTRSCTFAPTGPTVDPDAAPVVDAPAELRRLATALPFPLRVPAVPADWRANAADRVTLPGGGLAVRVGYLTPAGRYVRLVQSDAPEETLLAAETGDEPAVAQGPVDVGGRQWVGYTGPGRRAEPIWVTELPGPPAVRMLVTGSGEDADLRTLATAAVSGEPVAAPR
ncbi:hypothetical protein BJF78_16875 [Pseudonocardia sp. CNS-139]|nr:hypothetical protein BJF78_16875 [Pseudonocardia sp. CNS-139]